MADGQRWTWPEQTVRACALPSWEDGDGQGCEDASARANIRPSRMGAAGRRYLSNKT